jgi:hypothetical protein
MDGIFEVPVSLYLGNTEYYTVPFSSGDFFPHPLPPLPHALKVKGGSKTFEHLIRSGGRQSPLPPLLSGGEKNITISAAKSCTTNMPFSFFPLLGGFRRRRQEVHSLEGAT